MRTLLAAFVAIIAFASLLDWAESAPLRDPTREQIVKTYDFLKQYEYIDQKNSTNSGGAMDIDDPDFVEAIKNVQRFGDLAVTGKLNQETLELVNKRRCGLVDPIRKLHNSKDTLGNPKIGRYYLQGSYWKKKDLTYRFMTSTSDMSVRKQQEIMRIMLNKWDEVSTLNIREADSSVPDDKVDILISFVRGYHGDPYPFDGPGGTLAHAYYPHNNKGLSGDAHFDDDEDYTTGTKRGINLDWVALHEFGHSLGLEHSNVREAVMYPWYKGYIENVQLTRDDILGIQALYGRPKPKPKTTPSPVTDKPSNKHPRPPTSTDPTPSPTTTEPGTPDSCRPSTTYDAVVVEKNKDGSTFTHFISGDYVWTIPENQLNKRTKPRKLKEIWPDVQTPVDAAYRNKRGNVVFFKGTQFWEYDNNRQLTKRSGDIRKYFGSNAVANMDAVFVWEKYPHKTYVFKDSQYWWYNEDTQSLASGYPRPITVWRGFPSDGIDAAVTWVNNRSYIFKGAKYWRMIDDYHQVERGYPKSINRIWMKCNTNVGGLAVGSLGDFP